MIQLSNVTKLYGSVIGVNDITLQVPSGAHGLLGPNGSGKSTLLNLITGQLRPTLGEVRTLEHRPWNSRDLLRRIGVCPEQDVLYPNVTAFDWVTYLLKLHGFGRKQAAEAAERTLAEVGMEHAMYRPMGGYSRGMRQRTKIAQTLAHDPDLLILDEPFNGLDPIGRHLMIELFQGLVARGKGLLLASHVLHEVESITSSFLLICGGRLLASGSADEIHALLDDVPDEIRIRCNKPSHLARRLLETDTVAALRLSDDGQSLVVSTRSPATVYAKLPEWIAETDIQIDDFRSSGESLQSLFDSLMRIHRGRARA